jgi:vanadium chloroperoxidase
MVAGAALRVWIDLSLECIRRDHTPELSNGDQRGPFLSARALGMALAALHDGAVGPHLLVAPQANPSIGIGAGACRQVLLRRFPHQARFIDAIWQEWCERFGPTPNEVKFGRTLGDQIHALGSSDVSAAQTVAHPPRTGVFDPRPPPTDPNQGEAGPVWGTLARPLVLATHISKFPVPAGRDSDFAHYATDFAATVARGPLRREDGTRTPDEEVIGIFWGYDGPAQLGTPPRLYLQVALSVLDHLEKPLGLADELRVLAGVGIAMADAGIEAWFYKYNPAHLMWRPAIGIPTGAHATAHPAWLPLGRPDTNGKGVALTPNFPSYPSGHATFGAAAFEVLRRFLARKGRAAIDGNGLDDVAFTFTSDEFNGRNVDPRTQAPRAPVTLAYPSLWKAITDNSISRVLLGVHWQFDGVTELKGGKSTFGVPSSPATLAPMGGVWLGLQVASVVLGVV